MKNKIIHALYQTFGTWIGWILILRAHVIVFMSMAPGGIFEVKNGSWPLYIGVTSLIILLAICLTFMVAGLLNALKRTKWTIYKGWHYSIHLPRIHFGRTSYTLKVKFTESCRYEIYEPDAIQDSKEHLKLKVNNFINKIGGLSFGFHHKNSIRNGWRYNPGTDLIDLFLYEYIKGERVETPQASVHIGEEVELYTEKTRRKTYATVKVKNLQSSFIYKDGYLPAITWGYWLFFYFGGKPKAPHNITALIEINPK